MDKFQKMFFILAGIVVLLFLYILLWNVLGLSFELASNPSEPIIKYGEFPFKLTYEINGEMQVIQDAIICEFIGFENHGTAGVYRKWNTELKSGKERITLLDVSDQEIDDEIGRRILEFYFSYGTAEYYMDDDLGQNKSIGEMHGSISYMYKKAIEEFGYSAITADSAYEKYKIRLISWECAPPIENTFK